MAKRRLLQWMRDRLNSHAEKVVFPAAEKKAMESAYRKAAPLVSSIVHKKFPPADMKILAKYDACSRDAAIKLQFPNGVVTEFAYDRDEGPFTTGRHYNRIYLTDATTATSVERWIVARDAYKAERKKRLDAYTALICGASYVEDIIDLWPEAKGLLPAGSPPIALGPEQIALVKADMRERKAA